MGLDDHGDHHVRFALIEKKERTRQAPRGIKQMLAKGMVVNQGPSP
jgi:alanine-synthesizing transaminase